MLDVEVNGDGEKAGGLCGSWDPVEAQCLVRVSRTAKDRVRLRRAGMMLESLQGRSAPEMR